METYSNCCVQASAGAVIRRAGLSTAWAPQSGLRVRRGQGIGRRNYHHNYNYIQPPSLCCSSVPRRTWQVSSLPRMCSGSHYSALQAMGGGIRGFRGSCNVLIYSLTISIFIVNCLCTNLARNKSSWYISRFHFTSHKIQLCFSSCINVRTSSSSHNIMYLGLHPLLLLCYVLQIWDSMEKPIQY